MYRFDPRTFVITPHAGNFRTSRYSFDYWGYCYANDGTGGRSYQVRPEGSGFKMHELLTKGFDLLQQTKSCPLSTRGTSTRLPDL